MARLSTPEAVVWPWPHNKLLKPALRTRLLTVGKLLSMTRKRTEIDIKEDSGAFVPVQLPEPTLRRLPWYLAFVTTLRKHGEDYVSSTRISQNVGVDSSQIAKDLSFINIKGKTRIGYQVSELESALKHFLGFARLHNAVIIGTGSLGSALMRDRGLHRYGLNIVAGFDNDPDIVGKESYGVRVFHIDRLEDVCRELDVDIAAITVPVGVAQEAADACIRAGLRAIWNFTPWRIQAPEGVVVQNTSIYAHLALIYNRLQNVDTEIDVNSSKQSKGIK